MITFINKIKKIVKLLHEQRKTIKSRLHMVTKTAASVAIFLYLYIFCDKNVLNALSTHLRIGVVVVAVDGVVVVVLPVVVIDVVESAVVGVLVVYAVVIDVDDVFVEMVLR